MILQKIFKKHFPLKILNFTRFYAVAVEQNPSDILNIKKPRQKRKEKLVPSQDVRNFFEDNQLLDVYNLFPKKYLSKKYKSPDHFFISHPNAAEIIANYLISHCNNDKCPLIEINPSAGLLTEQLLLKSNIQDIRLYEVKDELIPYLTTKFENDLDRIRIIAGDFIGIWKLVYQDKYDNKNRLDEFMSGIQAQEWNNISFRLFGCTGSLNFFKHLINSTVAQNSFMSFGRCELIMVTTPELYIHLTCQNDAGYMLYRSTSILFQIMFEHYFITKIPKTNFLPWIYPSKKSHTKQKFHDMDTENLYLVRIVPRKDLFQLCSPEDIQFLWFFIKQHCNSRTNKIIPTLEKWIPGAGHRLIVNTEKSETVEILQRNETTPIPHFLRQSTTMSTKDYFENITIYTEFGDLTPSQLLTLFHQFKNWPGYKNSSFVTCVENNLLKMDTSGVTNVDGIEIPEEANDDNDDDVDDVDNHNDDDDDDDDDNNDNDSNSKSENENISTVK